jgi:hypothetical protein
VWDDRIGRRASFTTDFSFAISGNETHDRGDGMAFFIGPSRLTLTPDSDGAFLGLFSNNKGYISAWSLIQVTTRAWTPRSH